MLEGIRPGAGRRLSLTANHDLPPFICGETGRQAQVSDGVESPAGPAGGASCREQLGKVQIGGTSKVFSTSSCCSAFVDTSGKWT
jgi:hypothetical protein